MEARFASHMPSNCTEGTEGRLKNSKNWQWTTEGDVSTRRSTPALHGGSSSRQTIDICIEYGLMSIEPGKLIGTKLFFSYESRFHLWDHDGRIHVRCYAGKRCLPECVIERNSGPTPRFMVWGAISYHGRFNLLRIEGNVDINSTGYPRVTTPNEGRYLAVTAKRNRRSKASDLSRQLSSATGTTVSRQTVYRCLGHIGLYARRPVRCVPVTATHCRLRLTLSIEHTLRTLQQWSCGMISDESRFSL
ncbi:transposable element Tcb1 transposase [Trichonephila clavipes]|nr:transposable element Tcb1 transposase [Trichonephila clavipes]